jgi:hypothetical protein
MALIVSLVFFLASSSSSNDMVIWFACLLLVDVVYLRSSIILINYLGRYMFGFY